MCTQQLLPVNDNVLIDLLKYMSQISEVSCNVVRLYCADDSCHDFMTPALPCTLYRPYNNSA